MSVSRMVPADFELGSALGAGSFSKVVTASHVPTGRRYAIKVVSKQQICTAPSDEEKRRMAEVAIREARMLRMCSHSNIVRFHASMQGPQDLMYVTELCDGGELLEAIKAWGTIPLEAARHVLAELFSAIWYLHHAPKHTQPGVPDAPLESITILHRDIKPENIMLMSDKHVRLIDFGTAVVCRSVDERPEGEHSSKGRAKTFCGTAPYMSPELLRNNYTCTASDYWACGCVLYHMLVGKRPFDGSTEYFLIQSILEKEPEYPEDLDDDAKDLIHRLLSKSPDERPGREEVQNHPFFVSIDFDGLATKEVAPFWVRNVEWEPNSLFSTCVVCRRAFFLWRRRRHCHNCGKLVCSSCSANHITIPGCSSASPERVCDSCFGKIRGDGAEAGGRV
ncbi:protein kinase [Trypanosoma brucei equiperdum]|uniref:non-specific serine/threonine protein kinase n=1 Tax=Trypanosoma brucei equiperdum TaxID=630700 RepID=A0A3L6L1L8_9TRYP|nr:protein kinase [Trypanosoma brucei equiperdum]